MGTEKNYQKFFAASPSGEPMAPSWNQRLEKNGTFFDMREGVILIIFKRERKRDQSWMISFFFLNMVW